MILDVSFLDAEREMYVLPIGVECGDATARIREQSPERIIAEVSDRDGRTGILFDAAGESSLISCSRIIRQHGSSASLPK
jgi:hypothetical protein